MAHRSDVQLASYAIRSADCGGRAHIEPEDPLRGPFELDRHRIIESTAFRRLEGKTQVFAPAHHDHFRTRLTHTLEAAQVARCLAVGLRANESLAEAITLAHDLGHPPFGHAGEAALNEAMAGAGGFNHNEHSVRVVEYLEHPFPAFRGLNLTHETLSGLKAHETRYDMPAPMESDTDNANSRAAGFSPRGTQTFEPLPRASVEAQIASVADRLAYGMHDLEDAIGAEFVGLEELTRVALWQQAYGRVVQDAGVDGIHAIRRVVLDAMLSDLLVEVVTASAKRLEGIPSRQHAREAGHSVVAASDAVGAQLDELETFLREGVYDHPTVAEMDAKGRGMVLALFEAYREDPDALPSRFSARLDEQGIDRVVCDYLAGMTDRFCRKAYERHVGT